MGKVGRIALQGTCWGFLSPLLLSFLFYTTTSGISAAADGSSACGHPIARVVSIQGSVEIQRTGQTGWSAVSRLDTSLCYGDRLRTGPVSRSALFIQPESLLRVDQNTTIAVGQTEKETLIEFFQNDNAAADTPQTCGAGYFISRFPKKLRVNTPFFNAAVEGTEFLVALRCISADLSVFEGKVLVSSVDGTTPAKSVGSGETLSAGVTEPPAIKVPLKPADAVQWTLYYPPLTPAGTVIADDCRSVAADDRVPCLVARAEQRLRAGRVEEAQANIGDALAAAPYNSDAKALSSIISLARNNKAEALRLAGEAVESTANSAPAWLALSYAQQADFKLEAALTSAKHAADLTPSSAIALARVAELQLSLGWTREAEKTAKQAVAANPSESRAHMILGFVHLAQINVKEAREDFEHSIELDSTDPLSRLGLGLAIIRKGKLVEGREQIEIAVALEPTNSLIRSYVGKAYYEENSKERDHLASLQFGLAKQLDPNDPTPWFYDAILKQSQNNPINALEDLQKSTTLNDNRAIYRSRLLLDEDLAARSARLARVYGELGFEQLALVEAYESLAIDPDNFSGHRLLADAFLSRPRHEIARVSELLQSQLWQPLNVTPIETQLIDDQSFVLRGAGPTTAGLNEFNPLFVQQGFNLQASGVTGGNRTAGDQILASGIFNQFSASVGQLHYETAGFQQGWGLNKDLYNALVQIQVSPETSAFAEARYFDQTQGDLSQNFFGPPLSERLLEKRELYRLGFSHRLTDAISVSGVGTQEHRNEATEFPAGTPVFGLDTNDTAGELQVLYKGRNFSLLIGGGHFRSVGNTEFVGFGSFPNSEATSENIYGYAGYEPIANILRFELGVSSDSVNDPNSFTKTLTQINPKFGIVFNAWPGTTLRAAAFRTMRRDLIGNQTIEPTQVAGFNQFYDDSLATDARRIGVGLDQKISQNAFAGIELSKRRLSIPQAFTDPLEKFEWNERDYRGYFYWAPHKRISTTIEYSYERIIEDPVFAESFLDVRTQKLPLGLRVFSESAQTSVYLKVTGVRQTGMFRVDPLGPDFANGKSEFWLTDIGVSYSLPRRLGLLTIEVRNLFDKQYSYQETDILTPTLARERLGLARLTLCF